MIHPSLFDSAQLVVSLAVLGMIVVHLRRGAIFLPSHPKVVTDLVRALEIKPGEHAVDLGSGDGRIVIALAKAGAIATGYEVNPLLVWWSRWNIRKAGVADRARIVGKSFWSQSFRDTQAVAIFGMTHIMKELGEKLRRELPPGARVVSTGFHFPDWKEEEVAEGIYLYRIMQSV